MRKYSYFFYNIRGHNYDPMTASMTVVCAAQTPLSLFQQVGPLYITYIACLTYE